MVRALYLSQVVLVVNVPQLGESTVSNDEDGFEHARTFEKMMLHCVFPVISLTRQPLSLMNWIYSPFSVVMETLAFEAQKQNRDELISSSKKVALRRRHTRSPCWRFFVTADSPFVRLSLQFGLFTSTYGLSPRVRRSQV